MPNTFEVYTTLHSIFETYTSDLLNNRIKQKDGEDFLHGKLNAYLTSDISAEDQNKLQPKSQDKRCIKIFNYGDQIITCLQCEEPEYQMMCEYCYVYYKHNDHQCKIRKVTPDLKTKEIGCLKNTILHCSYNDQCVFNMIEIPNEFGILYKELLNFAFTFFSNLQDSLITKPNVITEQQRPSNIYYSVCMFYHGQDNDVFVKFLLENSHIDKMKFDSHIKNILNEGVDIIFLTNDEQQAWTLKSQIDSMIRDNGKSENFACEYFPVEIYVKMDICLQLMRFINSYRNHYFEICEIRNDIIFNHSFLKKLLFKRSLWKGFHREFTSCILLLGVDTREGRKYLYDFLRSNMYLIHQNYIEDNGLVYYSDLEENLIGQQILNDIYLKDQYVSNIFNIYSDLICIPYISRSNNVFLDESWKLKFCKICTILERVDLFLQNVMFFNYKEISCQIVQMSLDLFKFCQSFDRSYIFSFERFNELQEEGLQILDTFMHRFQSIKKNILILLGRDLNKFFFFVEKLIRILQIECHNIVQSRFGDRFSMDLQSINYLLQVIFKDRSLALSQRLYLSVFIEVLKDYHLSKYFFKYFEHGTIIYLLCLPLLDTIKDFNTFRSINNNEEENIGEIVFHNFNYLMIDELLLVQFCIIYIPPAILVQIMFSVVYPSFRNMSVRNRDLMNRGTFFNNPNYFKFYQMIYNVYTEMILLDTIDYNYSLGLRSLINIINYDKITLLTIKNRFLPYMINIKDDQIVVILEKIAKVEIQDGETLYSLKSEYICEINQFSFLLKDYLIVHNSNNILVRNINYTSLYNKILRSQNIFYVFRFLISGELFLCLYYTFCKYSCLKFQDPISNIEYEMALELLNLITSQLINGNTNNIVLWVDTCLNAIEFDVNNDNVFLIIGNPNIDAFPNMLWRYNRCATNLSEIFRLYRGHKEVTDS